MAVWYEVPPDYKSWSWPAVATPYLLQVGGAVSKIVLLVDYEPRSIDRIRSVLGGLGVTMVLARDGGAAEREFHRTLPDLTLIQDILPKKTGFQVCRDFKDATLGAGRPVVLIAHAPRQGQEVPLGELISH